MDPHAGAGFVADVEQAYRLEGPRLQRALFLYSGDRTVADDAVAEAFAQLLRRGDVVRNPAAWVWRAAFRIAAGELRDQTGREDEVPDQSYELEEPLVDLMAALRKLSPKQRASVVLHHFAGYPASDVAGLIGSTAAAVAVHLSRGRKRLRLLMGVVDD